MCPFKSEEKSLQEFCNTHSAIKIFQLEINKNKKYKFTVEKF